MHLFAITLLLYFSDSDATAVVVGSDIIRSEYNLEEYAEERDSEHMHFWDGRCNPLKYRDWDYLSTGVSSLQDVAWDRDEGFELTQRDRSIASPHLRMRSLAMDEYGASWIKYTNGPSTDVWVTIKEKLSELHLSDSDQGSLYSKPWYEFSTFEHWSFYKRDFPEVSFPIARNVRRAADLSSDGRHLIFTHEVAVGEEDEYDAWKFKTPALQRTFTLIDIQKKLKIALESPCIGADTENTKYYILSPAVVGDWVLLEKWDADAKVLNILLYNIDRGTRKVVTHYAGLNHVIFQANLWNATNGVVTGTAPHAFFLFLDVEFAGETPLSLASYGEAVYGIHLDWTNVRQVSIVYTELPSGLRCFIPAEELVQILHAVTYSYNGESVVQSATSRNFSRVLSSVGAGNWIFSILHSPEDPPLYTVAATQIYSEDWTEGERRGCLESPETHVVDSVTTADTVTFVSSFHTGVVISVGKNNTRYLIGEYTDRNEGEGFSVCRLFDPAEEGEVGEAVVFHDVVLYQREDNGSVRLMMADLNKDNDAAWDIVDRFPLRNQFVNDTDNDGIGDAGDLVEVHGRCTDHLRTDPSECVNDLVILYSAWGAFVVVMVSVCLAVGCYRKKHLDDLYLKRQATAREWIDRQWRESARHDIPEQELFTLMAEIDERIQRQEGFRGELVMQSLLFLLTIISVGLWIVSMWRSNPSLKFERTLAWIDFFTSTVFLMDLVYRWFFRIEGEYKSFKDYCIKNWYDFPSLISDIPGLTGAGTLSILVVARLIRVLRIFKMFRVVRLYHRVTQQQAILALILRYDTMWQTVFVCGLILSLGVVIKLIEQNEQAVFDPYENVLWFCVVTVTTIGYGDMVPENPVSRIIAVFLMVSGIGIIGVLTASMGESVRDSGIDKSMLNDKVRRVQQGKWRLSLEVLRYSVLYNPILALFKPYERGTCSHPHCLRSSRVITAEDSVVTVTYQNSRYHASCFRCADCGKTRTEADGACWVVPEYAKANQSVKRRRRTASVLGAAYKDTGSATTASVFLHKRCLRRARGGDHAEVQPSPCSDKSAMRTEDDAASTVDSIISQASTRESEGAMLIEELSVQGLFGVAERYNGSYTRRMAGNEFSPVLFDHDVSGLAIITYDDGQWQLLFRLSDQIETCAASSKFLVGVWATPTELSKLYGTPVVEDVGSQLHYWHVVYDPLDMPVRNLVINYASHRTRQQFSNLLESLTEEGNASQGVSMGMGKFGAAVDMPRRSTTAEHIQCMERLRYQIKVVTELDEKRTKLRTPCEPGEKLTLLLRTHKLRESGKVTSFDLMRDHLEYLIFKKNATRPCGTSLEKVFAIQAMQEASHAGNRYRTDDQGLAAEMRPWDENDLDWTDTVEWTMHEVERCLCDHGVDRLPQYNSVRIELENLVLSYDRVLMCQWAWQHLSWKNWQEGAVRPLKLRVQLTDMPVPPGGRTQYAQYETSLLDPLADNLERHQLETGKELAASSLLHASSTNSANIRRASSMESVMTTGMDQKCTPMGRTSF